MPRRTKEPRIVVQARVNLRQFASVVRALKTTQPLAIESHNVSSCVRAIIADASKDLELMNIEESAAFLMGLGFPKREILAAVAGYVDPEDTEETALAKAERLLKLAAEKE